MGGAVDGAWLEGILGDARYLEWDHRGRLTSDKVLHTGGDARHMHHHRRTVAGAVDDGRRAAIAMVTEIDSAKRHVARNDPKPIGLDRLHRNDFDFRKRVTVSRIPSTERNDMTEIVVGFALEEFESEAARAPFHDF